MSPSSDGSHQRGQSGPLPIYPVDADGGAHVEQLYATELDALRANKDNVDPRRKVRFLPYGIVDDVRVAGRAGGRPADDAVVAGGRFSCNLAAALKEHCPRRVNSGPG